MNTNKIAFIETWRAIGMLKNIEVMVLTLGKHYKEEDIINEINRYTKFLDEEPVMITNQDIPEPTINLINKLDENIKLFKEEEETSKDE